MSRLVSSSVFSVVSTLGLLAAISVVQACTTTSTASTSTPSDGGATGSEAVLDGSTDPRPDAEAPTQDDCGCGKLEQCAAGDLCVAKLVPLKGGYSIDATEVTRSQYAAWLATEPVVDDQPAECSANVTFEPESNWAARGCDGEVWPPGTKGDHPVVCVDWCDALAYCKGVGKRLCGDIAGGPTAWADHADATKSQWYNACSAGGVNNYPYGGTTNGTDGYEPDTCNGREKDIGTTLPVASSANCQSKDAEYAGVYDMSGNVREWEDSCSADGDAPCRVRGGSFGDSYYENLPCHDGFYNYRTHSYSTLGFRCCSL